MQAQEKEEFRQYLERNGVVDGLTSALVKLYETHPKPNDALGFVKGKLGTSEEVIQLRGENESLRAQIQQLQEHVAQLESQLPSQ